VEECDVVGLDVVHGAAHAGVAFAEAEVVGGVVFGGFAAGPIPLAAVLEVDDVDGVVADDGASGLKPQVVDAAEAFFEDLRGHDGGTDGEDDAAVEGFDGAGKRGEVMSRGASDGSAVEHGVVGDDVVADTGMDGEGDFLAEGGGEDGGGAPAMEEEEAPGFELVGAHGLEELGARGGKRVGGLAAEVGFEGFGRGEGEAVFLDEAAEGFAVAFGTESADEEGEVDVAAGFVPGAKGAGGDVFADAFGGAAEP
jgi:hypothetical protein